MYKDRYTYRTAGSSWVVYSDGGAHWTHLVYTAQLGGGPANLGRVRSLCRWASSGFSHPGGGSWYFLYKPATFFPGPKPCHSHGSETLGSLTWPCICQQYTFTRPSSALQQSAIPRIQPQRGHLWGPICSFPSLLKTSTSKGLSILPYFSSLNYVHFPPFQKLTYIRFYCLRPNKILLIRETYFSHVKMKLDPHHI